MPQDIPANCDGCDKRFSIENALSFPKVGLVLERHDNAAKEWGAREARSLFPSAITYEPKINSRAVQGGRTGAGARQEGGEAGGGTKTVFEAQGGRVRTVNGADILVGQLGQVGIPAESRADAIAHGFWKQGTTAMFDIQIVNLDAGFYPRMTPEKDLAKAEKETKDLYLQACLEHRSTFTTMVYSSDGIPGAGALATHKRLAALISYNLKQEY